MPRRKPGSKGKCANSIPKGMSSNGQLELLFAAPAAPTPRAPEAPPLLTPPPACVPAATVATPRPEPLPEGARWREVATEQQAIGFVLLRSRRRSIGFVVADDGLRVTAPNRSEEHTSELQSLMRISYAVFCLKKKNTK